MSNESLRLAEKQWEELIDTVICIGDDDSREVIFKENIPQLLDAQIADLLSKVSTPKELRGEIEKIVYDHASEHDGANAEFTETENPCAFETCNSRTTEKVVKLFQHHALSLQEQARKDEREKWISFIENVFRDTDSIYVKSAVQTILQALQKEG